MFMSKYWVLDGDKTLPVGASYEERQSYQT